MPEIRIAFVEPDPPPTFHHTDVDGDFLFVATADIPGQGAGVYFRTDPKGSSLPVDRLDELIDQLHVIADAAREALAAPHSPAEPVSPVSTPTGVHGETGEAQEARE